MVTIWKITMDVAIPVNGYALEALWLPGVSGVIYVVSVIYMKLNIPEIGIGRVIGIRI